MDANGEAPTNTAIEKQPVYIAGFRRRVAADLIDYLLLAIILLVIGLIGKSFFYNIGPYGRLFSFTIATAYFTVFGSGIGNGQTVGKQLLHLVIVDNQGCLLPLKKSFRRSALLFAILLVNGWKLPIFLTSPLMTILDMMLVFGGLFSLLYGYIFNRTTRQGPHDLISGSYVVHISDDNYSFFAPLRPRVHTNIVASIFLISIVAGILSLMPFLRDKELYTLYKEINDNNGSFFNVDVQGNQNRLTLTGWIAKDCQPHDECAPLAQKLLDEASANYDSSGKNIRVDVILVNTIDLGFVSFSSNTVSVGVVNQPEKVVYHWQGVIYHDDSDSPGFTYFQEGIDLASKGYYGQAVRKFTHAIESDPSLWEAYYVRAGVYWELGEYNLGLQDLHTCRDMAPVEQKAIIDQAIVLYEAQVRQDK